MKINEIRAIVVDVDDNDAVIMMVDSNCQRSKILPSEKAFSYKMKLDAIKQQRQQKVVTDSVAVHKTATGGRYEISTDTGDIIN